MHVAEYEYIVSKSGKQIRIRKEAAVNFTQCITPSSVKRDVKVSARTI
jgi:hypothetical protein